MRRIQFGALVVLAVAALGLTALNPSILAGDPLVYRMRMVEILGGGVPYFDVAFEHFPAALVPMLATWFLGGWGGSGWYTAIFALLMTLCLAATLVQMERTGSILGVRRAGTSWLGIAAPLFPFVIFRSEPWVVLLTTVALTSILLGQKRLATISGWLAILGKGWPVALAAIAWAKQRRGQAIGLISAFTLTCTALLLTPGFRSGREFSGLHTESLVGGFIILVRTLAGQPIGRIDAAGATYLEADPPLVLLQLTFGVVVGTIALVRLNTRAFTPIAGTMLAGSLIAAVLVGSPLLSPQFLFWLTPFLALHPQQNIRRLGLGVMALTTIYLVGLEPNFEGNPWVVATLALRNVFLLTLAIRLAWVMGQPKLPGKEQPIFDLATLRRRSLLSLAIAVVVSWLVVAITHVNDLFNVDHASRVRIALADSANAGLLYPPVFDGIHFGGTRFMPGPLILHAGMARVTGEYVASGKILVYLSFALAGWLFLAILRRRGVSWYLALGLLATVLLSQAVLFTTLGIRWDALSLALQLAAVFLVDRYFSSTSITRGAALFGSSVLCAAAVLTKSTALWAPAAILIWLLIRSRRAAWAFLGSLATIGGAAFLILQEVTNGLFWHNIARFSTAGMADGFSVLRAVQRFVDYNYRKSPVSLLIIVLAAMTYFHSPLATGIRSWKGIAQWSLYQWSFGFALVGTILLMSDVGVADNHFIDFLTIGALIVGRANSESSDAMVDAHSHGGHRTLLTEVVLVFVLGASLLPVLSNPLSEALDKLIGSQNTSQHQYSIERVKGLVGSGQGVLSEDPLVAVLHHEQPVVLDSWILRRLESSSDSARSSLVRRVSQEEFNTIILWKWDETVRDDYLFPEMRSAIAATYVLCRESAEHLIYYPASSEVADKAECTLSP